MEQKGLNPKAAAPPEAPPPHLPLSLQRPSVVEIVLAVGKGDHSVGVLVQLELNGSVDLHLGQIGVDDPDLVLVGWRSH